MRMRPPESRVSCQVVAGPEVGLVKKKWVPHADRRGEGEWVSGGGDEEGTGGIDGGMGMGGDGGMGGREGGMKR